MCLVAASDEQLLSFRGEERTRTPIRVRVLRTDPSARGGGSQKWVGFT